MAAPPPYWKKKTRPCPFYSRGCCLFSDACNFVHSVKVNHHDPSSPERIVSGSPEGDVDSIDIHDDESDVQEKRSVYSKDERGRDSDLVVQRAKLNMDGDTGDSEEVSMLMFARRTRSSRNSLTLSRTPSERRRRVVIMSPPRSPRTSSLLSALEDVIGPDVEEVEVTDEEDEDEGEGENEIEGDTIDEEREATSLSDAAGLKEEMEQALPSTSPLSSDSSSQDSALLPYYWDSPATISKVQEQLNAPPDESFPSTPFNPSSDDTIQADSTSTAPPSAPPRRSSLCTRILSPIITHHLDRNHTTIVQDNNTLEIHSHSHQQQQQQQQHRNHQQQSANIINTVHTDDPLTPSRGSRLHSTFDLLTSPFASPVQRIQSLTLSPQLFPACDSTSPVLALQHQFQHQHQQRDSEVALKGPYEDDDVESLGPLDPNELPDCSIPMPCRSSVHLAPLSMSQSRCDSLDSPSSVSFGPSPVTPACNTEHAPNALVDREGSDDNLARETILERRAKHTSTSPKHLSVVSVKSPTKELRESFQPASLEKTVRPAPSPLYDDSLHSTSHSAPSSSVMLSPRPSWAELQRRSSRSSKVPFGFRQSVLVGQKESSSLAQKLASRFSRDSSASHTGPTSSLSPDTAYHPRPASRVDVLSGRARSVSPALFGPGPSSYRHSIAVHSSSAPPFQTHASDNLPHSASQAEFFADRLRSDSPVQAGGGGSSSQRASWMRPLRLSQVYNSNIVHSRCPSSLSHDNRLSTASTRSSQGNVQIASQGSTVQNTESSSARSSIISTYLNDSYLSSHDDRSIIAIGGSTMPSMESVLAATDSRSDSPEGKATVHHDHSQSKGTSDEEVKSNADLLSPLSGSMRGLCFDEFSHFQWSDSDHEYVERRVVVTEDIPPDHVAPPVSYQDTHIPQTSKEVAPANTSTSAPSHAIATPRPDLMFAIASDNPTEVERVLSSGEAHPNDVIGPQSALEFALTNDALVNKTEIVKTLLAFGADPTTLPAEIRNAHNEQEKENEEENADVLAELPSESTRSSFTKRKKRESALNPAMKYYLNRAAAGSQAVQTSAALRRSDFRSLARMRFDFIGQDRALEHLYWVLGMHSQQPIGTPLVVLCCGPCGHGKSLLARKFGSLLDVPTHTVNMTVLKTSHDLWQCPSMSPYDPPSDKTLAEFLEANGGKRCVVVLDEIDKNEDERTLWSLLAPWELGRCSIDAGRKHIDVRNVIWLGTSNIGQDLVFEHHAARSEPDTVMSKAEYRKLMNTLRPLVTERLGTSLMSRVTAVLPFVPFTPEEKLAIASEAILALGGEEASELSPEDFESLALRCVSEYVESDGARSLYRSVSTHLMEMF